MCILANFMYAIHTYHSTTKSKPIYVKCRSYIDFGVESNDKNSKFEVGDLDRISKHEAFFAIGYNTNWVEEDFVVKNIKNNQS